MANITIKNIPADLYEMLKRQAKSNHRSINSEIIFSIKRMVGFTERDEPEDILREARELRKKMRITLTEEEINEAKRAGRE
jgi:antitoxin FitA